MVRKLQGKHLKMTVENVKTNKEENQRYTAGTHAYAHPGGAERVRNFDEVAFGYSAADALLEADRCLICPNRPKCTKACPVDIDIPAFIQKIIDSDFRGAWLTVTDANLMPAVCGRVCPQEDQCEGVCVIGNKLEPVAIGRLERFLGDLAIDQGWTSEPEIEPNGFKSASSAPAPPVSPARRTWPRQAAKSPFSKPAQTRGGAALRHPRVPPAG